MFSDVMITVLTSLNTWVSCGWDAGTFIPAAVGASHCTSLDQQSFEMPDKKNHTHAQTPEFVLLPVFVARFAPHWLRLDVLSSALLFHSDLSRQLSTLTLPSSTSVTWHSHLWLPLRTPNLRTPSTTQTNTDQIYTQENTSRLPEERRGEGLQLHRTDLAYIQQQSLSYCLNLLSALNGGQYGVISHI